MHDKWKNFFTNVFEKLYLPLFMYYRTFVEWFLIAFFWTKYLWLCFYWREKEKSITVIVNANNSSLHFYCCHFVKAEDIPQSYVPIFSSQIEKYTNADLKICKNLRLYLEIICWRFHIKTPFTFWEMRLRDMWKVCSQTFRNNGTC